MDEIDKVKEEGCQDLFPAANSPNELTNTKMSAAVDSVPLEIDSVKCMPLQSPSYRG